MWVKRFDVCQSATCKWNLGFLLLHISPIMSEAEYPLKHTVLLWFIKRNTFDLIILLLGLQLAKILAHRQMLYWRKHLCFLPPLPVKTLSAAGSCCPLVETKSRFHDFTGCPQILKVYSHVSHEIVSVIWKSWVTTSDLSPSPGLLHNEDIFPFPFLSLFLPPSTPLTSVEHLLCVRNSSSS